MKNIDLLRKEYELLNNLLKLYNDNKSTDLYNEISKTIDGLLNTVGDLLSNEFNKCTCDGVNEGCNSLLCKSQSKHKSVPKSSIEDKLYNDMIYDNKFYVTIPQIPHFKSYMFRSLSEFNKKCFIDMYEFGNNDFILPLELDNLLNNGILFDIHIKMDGCSYTEIWKNVKLNRVNRQELRRTENVCKPNPIVLYIEGEIESKEYIENIN